MRPNPACRHPRTAVLDARNLYSQITNPPSLQRNEHAVDFENVDLQAVLDDIAETGYSTSQAGEKPSSSDLAGYQALADDGVEVVIIDTDALQSTQLRNLAQTVKDSGEDGEVSADAEDGAEASTVIVQAPNNTQVVSDVMSRYQIESNQGELHSSTGPQGVADFLTSADEAEPAFSWIYVLAIVGILLAVAATAAFARITYRR